MRVATRIASAGAAAALVGAAAAIVLMAQPRASESVREPVGSTLTGAWTVTLVTERGEFDTSWDLVQHDDGSLKGEIEGRRGSAEVEEGRVIGAAFTFAVTRDFQGQTFKLRYEGTFAEDALEGTLTAEGGQFTARFAGERAGGEERR